MSSQKNHKKLKFEERILSELNLFLRKNATDSRLQLMSFTKVSLNNDFSEAQIYWDTFDVDSKEFIRESLDNTRGRLRSHLAQVISARHTPALQFYYDSQFESEKEIESILDEESKKGRSF